MQHENLSIALDLDQLLRCLKRNVIEPQVWYDKRRNRHRSVILFAKVCEQEWENKTHDITAKSLESWADVRNENGNIIHFGTAVPSKYQPKKKKGEFDI